MHLFERFQQKLNTLLLHQPNLLIALSGGVDSVVLFHLLAESYPKNKLRAIHIHHGLSPNADGWAVFCQELCASFGVPFLFKKVQLGSQKGVEAEARQARYQAIGAHILPNEILVTAHHLDDQAETFLLALKRGSGVQGLGAMAEISDAHGFPLCRPLLHFTKTEIQTFAEQQKFVWITDESNENTDFERNFLRQEILPKLNQRWAHFNQMVARASQHCAEQQALLEELLQDELCKRSGFYQNLPTLDVQGFADFSRLKQQQLLRLWLKRCNEPMPSTAQLEQISTNLIYASKDKNPQLRLGEKVLRRHHQQLFLTPNFPQMQPFTATLQENKPLKLPFELGEIGLSNDGITYKKHAFSTRLPLPTELRHRTFEVRLGQQGKVHCYGKTQREEMKKIWQQHNIPVWLRPQTPLIFCEEQLVGVLCAFAPLA